MSYETFPADVLRTMVRNHLEIAMREMVNAQNVAVALHEKINLSDEAWEVCSRLFDRTREKMDSLHEIYSA